MNIKENLNLGDIVMYMNNDELEVRGTIIDLLLCGCIVKNSIGQLSNYIIYEDILNHESQSSQ